jgi:enoyl-CoA hydratase/carnithine racemase
MVATGHSPLTPSDDSGRVTVEMTDHVAVVTFARPDKRNALDGAQFAAIAAAGEMVKKLEGVRAVVLRGDGPSFCAGLDFSGFESMMGGSTGGGEPGNPGRLTESGLTHLGQQVCWVWQEIEVPVIAAVHGHALGGGLQIALGADVRIAHPDTQLSVREVHWGIIPDMTGTLTLSLLVRPDVARELTYTARVLDAREGHSLGLVTRLSDDPYSDAMAMAREIAARNPHAIRAAKRLLSGEFHRLAAAQFAAERDEVFALIGTPNQVEVIMANLEKREPVLAD